MTSPRTLNWPPAPSYWIASRIQWMMAIETSLPASFRITMKRTCFLPGWGTVAPALASIAVTLLAPAGTNRGPRPAAQC